MKKMLSRVNITVVIEKHASYTKTSVIMNRKKMYCYVKWQIKQSIAIHGLGRIKALGGSLVWKV